MRKQYLERPRSRHSGRALTIIFGALPATFYCYYAFLAFRVGLSQNGLAQLLLIGFALGGCYGTIALWRVAFGCRKWLDVVGLVVGVVAMLPILILTWDRQYGIAAASPVLVATIWLLSFLFRRDALSTKRRGSLKLSNRVN